MKFDFVNVISVISVIITVVISFVMIKYIVSNRERVKNPTVKKDKDSEYKKIIAVTNHLEFERERNTGEHFDDESVYLERAKIIREKTPFFIYVNGQ